MLERSMNNVDNIFSICINQYYPIIFLLSIILRILFDTYLIIGTSNYRRIFSDPPYPANNLTFSLLQIPLQSAEDVAISIQLASTSSQLQRHMLNLLSTVQLPGKTIKADTVSTIVPHVREVGSHTSGSHTSS